ncbi:coiled-coil domain-containing protein 174 [Atheta coriaria]|uniref:coiled-coil domain-containing protein 174 n=1 Tax=Dalotia coriaria TaxID=877792 RepID=UPI0031F43EF7
MSTYEISKSSLLSLKAEILKKQEELQKAKAENHIKLQKSHKKPLELKNRGVESRAANDGDVVDEELLKKSRLQLETKSLLYEKLSRGSRNELEKEDNRQYLVQFDKKALESKAATPSDDDEEPDKYPQEEEEFNETTYSDDDSEWVEFVDSFGRTRTCLKEDLASFKQNDKGLDSKNKSKSGSISPTPKKQEENIEYDEKNELLSADMRRNLLRQQWEREEQLLMDKSDLHYQDILFGEARTHGVGYYGFSKDESVRNEQQNALKNLRKETEAQQKQAQEVKQNRERQLAARVRAAQNRKRAREGLPPLTSDDEQDEKRKPEEELVEKVEKAASVDDKNNELRRQLHVRPWDLGKEGVDAIASARIRSGCRDPYDQDEWNAIQRSKRVQEFAPPQSYHAKHTTKRDKVVNPYKRTNIEPAPIQNECSDEESDEPRTDYGNCVPPPASFDYYGPSSSAKRSRSSGTNNMDDAIMQGLKFMREKVEQKYK